MKPSMIFTALAALAALSFSGVPTARAESDDNPLQQAQSILDAIDSSESESLKVAVLPAAKPEKLLRSGTYKYVVGDNDWTLVVSEDGRIQGRLKMAGKTYNVTGIVKEESGKVMVQWKVQGTPKWHDITDEVKKWQRVNN